MKKILPFLLMLVVITSCNNDDNATSNLQKLDAPQLLLPTNGFHISIDLSQQGVGYNYQFVCSSVEGAAEYLFEVSSSSNFNVGDYKYDTTEDTVTVFYLDDLQEGTTYYWRVRAFPPFESENIEPSDFSETFTFTYSTSEDNSGGGGTGGGGSGGGGTGGGSGDCDFCEEEFLGTLNGSITITNSEVVNFMDGFGISPTESYSNLPVRGVFTKTSTNTYSLLLESTDQNQLILIPELSGELTNLSLNLVGTETFDDSNLGVSIPFPILSSPFDIDFNGSGDFNSGFTTFDGSVDISNGATGNYTFNLSK